MKNKQSTEEEGSDVNLERRNQGLGFTQNTPNAKVILMLLKQSRN